IRARMLERNEMSLTSSLPSDSCRLRISTPMLTLSGALSASERLMRAAQTCKRATPMLSVLVKWIQLRVVASVGHTALGSITEHLNKATVEGPSRRASIATHPRPVSPEIRCVHSLTYRGASPRARKNSHLLKGEGANSSRL
ncbi:hypothetical protein COCVIDRAFT_103238, partial [Bipolaris victoriae FI3]